MKYYEILPTHTETPRNTTRKIANLYIEFNYHFLTLQKKIPLLLNRSVQKSPENFSLAGSSSNTPFKCFCLPEGQKLSNHDENQ